MALPVTPADINIITKLGFQLWPPANNKLDVFVNTHFIGLDLLKFVQDTEYWLQPLALDILNKSVRGDSGSPEKLTLEYYTSNYQDLLNRLVFKRTFIRSDTELLVIHDYLILPLVARGKRIGRKVLAFCLQHYLVMDVDKVFVHAALQNGGLEWARAGFRALQRDEVDLIYADAQQSLLEGQFSLVKRLYNNHYNNAVQGEPFPIIYWSGLLFMKPVLLRHNWHGVLNLKNSQDLFNFKAYVTS